MILHFMKVGWYAPERDVRVFFEQDTVSNVWTATSEDIPGQALEDEDLDELKELQRFAL